MFAVKRNLNLKKIAVTVDDRKNVLNENESVHPTAIVITDIIRGNHQRTNEMLKENISCSIFFCFLTKIRDFIVIINYLRQIDEKRNISMLK